MKFTFAPESRPLEGYTIKRAIYRGGFGEVYYALTDAGREVALKLLQNNTEVELRGVQQCLNLSHPNLVTIFDVRQDGDGDHWIIMEYIAGDTLDVILRKHPQGMPVEMVRNWLKGLTAGIAYLHSRGIVHRDLKPANMFMEDGTVKIGDIGLSKFIAPSRHSAQTQSVGTVHYMAPEVAKGRYGREVDIYATGIILYEMLTGELPFDGESTGEILMKHLSEPPDLTKLPPRLQGVVGKALHKDPKERFSRIEALQRAFEDAVLGIGDPVPVSQSEQPATNHQEAGTAADGIRVEVQTPRGTKSWHHQPGHESGIPKFVKVILIVILGIAFMRMTGSVGGTTWASMLMLVGAAAYVGTRTHHKPVSQRPLPPAKPKPTANPTMVKSPPRVIPARVESGDVFSGMFASVPISGLLIACLALLKPSLLGGVDRFEHLTPDVLGLFAAVSILGSWAIMLVPHLARHSDWRKKISAYHYGLAGAVVGALAYGVQQYLFVSHLGREPRSIFSQLGDQPLMFESSPSLLGYVTFFAIFFAFRNWQVMTSPIRQRRFRVTSVLVTVFVAWLTTMVFAFPSEIAIAWAVIISCVTQLAAPIRELKARPARKIA